MIDSSVYSISQIFTPFSITIVMIKVVVVVQSSARQILDALGRPPQKSPPLHFRSDKVALESQKKIEFSTGRPMKG